MQPTDPNSGADPGRLPAGPSLLDVLHHAVAMPDAQLRLEAGGAPPDIVRELLAAAIHLTENPCATVIVIHAGEPPSPGNVALHAVDQTTAERALQTVLRIIRAAAQRAAVPEA